MKIPSCNPNPFFVLVSGLRTELLSRLDLERIHFTMVRILSLCIAMCVVGTSAFAPQAQLTRAKDQRTALAIAEDPSFEGSGPSEVTQGHLAAQRLLRAVARRRADEW